MSNSELATVEPINQTGNVLAVISRAATDASVDISKMERLLDMQERVLAKQAEMAFYDAMSDLQAAMPTIKKEGVIKVGETVRSRYARFEDILGQTRDLLKEHGFSVSFKSNFVDGQLEITGTLSHKAGHHESTTMRLPFDSSGSKNNVQAIGSSVSYGKRYVYCMLLNINITEDDDDGVSADAANTLEKMFERLLVHNRAVEENMPSIMAIKDALLADDYETAYECFAEIPNDTLNALRVAYTKGGIFTTDEQRKMKSNEWTAARHAYHSGGTAA